MKFFLRMLVEEAGQDLVEYGLMIALLVIAGIAALAAYNPQIVAAFTAAGATVAQTMK